MAVQAGGVSFSYSSVIEEIAGKIEDSGSSLSFLWDKLPESLKISAQSRLSNLFGDASRLMRSSCPIQEETSEPHQTLLEDPVSEAPTTEVLLQYYAEQFVEAEELIAISFEKPEVLASYGLSPEQLRAEALQLGEVVVAQAKESADPEVARRLGYYQILKNRLENTLEEDRVAKIADEEARQKAFVQLQGKRSDDIQILKGMYAVGLPEATELLIRETQLKALDVWVSYEDERKKLTPEKQAVLRKVAELVVTGKAQTLATAVGLLQQNPEGLSEASRAYLGELQDEKLIGKLLEYTKDFPYSGDFVEAGYHSPAHVALLLQTEGGLGRTAYELYQLIQRMDVEGKATELVTSNIVALEGRGSFASGFLRGVYHVIRSTSLPEVAFFQVAPLTLSLRLAGKAQLGALAALGARGVTGRKAIALGWTTRFAVAGGAMFGIHTGADVGKALIAGKEVTEVLEPKHLGWNLLSSILSIAGIELMGKLGTALGLKVAPKLKLATVQNGQWALTGGGAALTKGMHHLFAYSGMTGSAWLMQGGIDGETAGRSLVDYWAFPAASKLNEVFFPAMTKGGMKQHAAIAKAESGLLKQALMQAIKADAARQRGALQGAAGMIGGLALLYPGMAEAMAKQPGGMGSVPWWAWLAAGALPFLGMAKVRKEDFIRPGNDRANGQAKWVADQIKARLWNDFGIERDPKVIEKKVEQEFIHYKKKGHQRHNDNVDPESFPEIVENLVSYFSGKAQSGGRSQVSGTQSDSLYVSIAQQGPSRAASKEAWAKLSREQRGALEERVARELEVEGRKILDMYGYESFETVEREMLFMVMEEVVARKEKLFEGVLSGASQGNSFGAWKTALGWLGVTAGLTVLLDPAQAFAATETMTRGGAGEAVAGLVAAMIPLAVVLKRAGSQGPFLVEAPSKSSREFFVGKNAKGELSAVEPEMAGGLSETLLRFRFEEGKGWVATALGRDPWHNGETPVDPENFPVKKLDGIRISELVLNFRAGDPTTGSPAVGALDIPAESFYSRLPEAIAAEFVQTESALLKIGGRISRIREGFGALQEKFLALEEGRAVFYQSIFADIRRMADKGAELGWNPEGIVGFINHCLVSGLDISSTSFRKPEYAYVASFKLDTLRSFFSLIAASVGNTSLENGVNGIKVLTQIFLLFASRGGDMILRSVEDATSRHRVSLDIGELRSLLNLVIELENLHPGVGITTIDQILLAIGNKALPGDVKSAQEEILKHVAIWGGFNAEVFEKYALEIVKASDGEHILIQQRPDPSAGVAASKMDIVSPLIKTETFLEELFDFLRQQLGSAEFKKATEQGTNIAYPLSSLVDLALLSNPADELAKKFQFYLGRPVFLGKDTFRVKFVPALGAYSEPYAVFEGVGASSKKFIKVKYIKDIEELEEAIRILQGLNRDSLGENLEDRYAWTVDFEDLLLYRKD